MLANLQPASARPAAAAACGTLFPGALARRPEPHDDGPPHTPGEQLADVLDEIGQGLLVADRAARVLHANRAALRICRDAQAVRLEGQQLRAGAAQDQAQLLQALAAASDQGRRTMLMLGTGGAPLDVGVTPLPARDGLPRRALLMFGKGQPQEPLTLQFFAQAHRLTSAETTVLTGLCRGLRPTDIAARAGVSITTVRTQIATVRQKTQTTSIADLLRRVECLPPMTSALSLALMGHG